MSVASGGSVDKAWFFNEETGVWFEVQYNPLSFNLERSAKWDEKPVPGNAPTVRPGVRSGWQKIARPRGARVSPPPRLQMVGRRPQWTSTP